MPTIRACLIVLVAAPLAVASCGRGQDGASGADGLREVMAAMETAYNKGDVDGARALTCSASPSDFDTPPGNVPGDGRDDAQMSLTSAAINGATATAEMDVTEDGRTQTVTQEFVLENGQWRFCR